MSSDAVRKVAYDISQLKGDELQEAVDILLETLEKRKKERDGD